MVKVCVLSAEPDATSMLLPAQRHIRQTREELGERRGAGVQLPQGCWGFAVKAPDVFAIVNKEELPPYLFLEPRKTWV